MLAAFLLAATTIVWPEEQSYGPYLRPDHGSAHAVAAGRFGVLLAWSERDLPFAAARVRVALLDRSARLVSPISVLPASRPNASAISPSVATDGTNFFVAFVEEDSRRQTFGVVVHGATGLPIGAPVPYGERTAMDTSNLGALLWDGAAYRLRTADGRSLALAHDGTILGTTTIPAALAADGTGATLGVRSMLVCRRPGGGGPFNCSLIGTRYDILWTAGAKSGTHITGFSPPLTTIAAAGHQFVIAWSGDELAYLLTGGGGQAVAVDHDRAAPAVDCDEKRCLLAYGTVRGDVHAAAFAPVPGATLELLRIATSQRVERTPHVRSLGGGRFLVSYASEGPDGHRLAGRIITFDLPKTHAVR